MTGQIKPITILGAGSWGTALALYLSRRGQEVRIWSVVPSEITEMLIYKENRRYLPGHPLPNTLYPMDNLEAAIKEVRDILMVVPSHGFRDTLKHIVPLISADVRLISATKGIDALTSQLLNEIVLDVLGDTHDFAVLSGPSFAKEVSLGLPCSLVAASNNASFVNDLIERFDSPIFRVFPSDDVVGVEVGGIVKNVIAIATGLFDGMKLGANARSALITLALAEIIRLGIALGGRQETLLGLSGLGDLILTCSDDHSRNRRLGLAIGRGKTVSEAEAEVGQVVEGKQNAQLVVRLAEKYGVKMPISETVWKLLQGKLSPEGAVLAMREVDTPTYT